MPAPHESSFSDLDRATVDELFAMYRGGRFGALAERASVLVAAHPQALVLHSLLAAARFELEDYEGAVASYSAALSIQPNLGKAHNGLGVAYLRLNRVEEALASFREAVHHAPDLAPAHFNLGIALEHSRRWREAAAHYLQATRHDPRHAEAHNALGIALWELGEFDGVAECFETALALRPDHVPAQRNLLGFLEQSNRHAALREALARARAALGDHYLIALYEGIVADIDGDSLRARRCLERAAIAGPGGTEPGRGADTARSDGADAAGLHDERQRLARLVRVCDQLDDPRAAVRYAGAANDLSRRIDASKGVEREAFLTRVSNRRRYFGDAGPRSADTTRRRADANRGNADANGCSADRRNADRPAHARPAADPPPTFIVGFPRSGTTLLDAMLRGHPSIEVAEETNAVATLVHAYAGRDDEGLACLDGLSRDELERLRALYLETLTAEADANGAQRVIDRFALNIVHAGELNRLFPEAQFILLLRHPADCVLSCFMRTFYSTSANANFYSLEDAAAAYERVFDLWSCYRRTLDIDVLEVRYEDLVADPEGVCRTVLTYLDLPWHANVLAHERTARSRPFIKTASYDQVTRPIYSDAAGRWRRYRDAMDPVLPVLEPWIERFGYSR